MAENPAHFNLIEALRSQYPDMSSGQRRIADCIVQQQDEAQFFTGAQLAAQTGLSESAVVRFAQFMGFGGYPDLRRAVCQDFRARATNTGLISSSRAAFANEPDPIHEIAHRDAVLVQETARRLDPTLLHDCAKAILAAGQIFVVGHRTSYAMAEYLAATLRQSIGTGTPLSFGTGTAYDVIGTTEPGDVVIAIATSPCAQQTIDLMYAAKTQGLRCIAITDNPIGALAQIADSVIVFETTTHTFTSSYVGVMTIVHILLALIGNQGEERVETVLTRLDAMNEAFRTRQQNEEVPCIEMSNVKNPDGRTGTKDSKEESS